MSSPAGEGWTRFDLTAAGRVLAAASFSDMRGETLTVFIEGDGAAHTPRGLPSRDPTPRDPVSLKIAQAWPRPGPKAWLGRLCQYVRERDPACAPEDWTLNRFSPPAVAATNAALDQLKVRAGASRLVLVGWSGGGTVATLAASKRSDVAMLITIAAPLDVGAWTKAIGVSRLPEDGDPISIVWEHEVNQLHLYGGRDRTVPAETQRWASLKLRGRFVIWPGEGHQCCWARKTARIVEEARRLLPCRRFPAGPGQRRAGRIRPPSAAPARRTC